MFVIWRGAPMVAAMSTSKPSKPAAALYLRVDGSVLAAVGDKAVEVALSPAQLLQLGVDALRVAVALDPHLMGVAAEALATTYVLPMEATQCPTH